MFVPFPPFLDQDEGRLLPLRAGSPPSLTAHFASIQQPQGAWRRPCSALAAEGDSGMDAWGLSSGGCVSYAPAFPGYEHLFAITSHFLPLYHAAQSDPSSRDFLYLWSALMEPR